MTGIRSWMAPSKALGDVVTMAKAAGVVAVSGSQSPAKKNAGLAGSVK